jgi:hypothetical protein
LSIFYSIKKSLYIKMAANNVIYDKIMISHSFILGTWI